MSTRPLNLPKFIFLMSDPSTRKLACDVAELMSSLDQTVYVDDFTAPIYEAFRTMWDRDWGADYGTPKATQALMLEAGSEKSEADCIESLTRWFESEFGHHQLGLMGRRRAVEQQALTEYIYVFRDATPVHIIPSIINNPHFTARDMLVVWLNGPTLVSAPGANIRHLYYNMTPPSDPAQIIADMEEEAR